MKACKKIGLGNVIQIWTARTEQGFEYRQHGSSDRTILDYGGLALIDDLQTAKKEETYTISIDGSALDKLIVAQNHTLLVYSPRTWG